MTTDEIILALVATGKFTLPEKEARCSTIGSPEDLGYKLEGEVRVLDKLVSWRLVTVRYYGEPHDMIEERDSKRIPTSCAHDMCAAHFAREAASLDIWSEEFTIRFEEFMGDGNSAAAIRVLWKAVNNGSQ